MAIRAKFPGTCDRCHQPFPKGAEIVRRPDDKFIHLTCASGQDDE